jgi:hypothetical protein
MSDLPYRVGEESAPAPEPGQGQDAAAPAGPRAGSGWTLAYTLVVAGGGELAAIFGNLGAGFRSWAALTLYVTVVAVFTLLVFGVLRTRPRRSR